MILPFSVLEWETGHFGYKTACCRPADLDQDSFEYSKKAMHSAGIRLAYFFADPADLPTNHILSENNCLLADQKVTFYIQLNLEGVYQFSEYIQSYPHDYTTVALRKLALQSGIYSRFKTDPQFNSNEFEILYNTWIDKSVSKELADDILVYYLHGEEKGLITVLKKNEVGNIGLLSVDETARGNSIGKELMQSALSHFASKGLKQVEVVTQMANQGACRFYTNMGFEIKKVENIYHLWMKK